MSQIGPIIALIVAGLATGWGALVLCYLGPGTAGVRTTAAWGYFAISLLASCSCGSGPFRELLYSCCAYLTRASM